MSLCSPTAQFRTIPSPLSYIQFTHFVDSQTQWVCLYHPVVWSVYPPFVTTGLSGTIHSGALNSKPSHLSSTALPLQVHGCQPLGKSQRGHGGSCLLLNLPHTPSLHLALSVGPEAMGKVKRVTKGFQIFKWYIVSGWSGLICVICNKCNKSTIYFQLSSKIINFFFQR